MNRRGVLAGAATAGGLALAGCLERLGFEERSVWRDQPLVEDRPDAVYLPASREEMKAYGTAADGTYAVELSYTFPHRFWLVAGDPERVDVAVDDSVHLMCTAWDPSTNTVLPVNLGLEIDRNGETVLEQTLWPMLSQRMGFHYGDNISFPEEGEYTARLRIGPLDIAGAGSFDGRFESSSTLEIGFEYSRSDVHDLGFEVIDEAIRGTRNALPLMNHGDYDAHGSHDFYGGHNAYGSHDDSDSYGDHDHGAHGEPTRHAPTSAGPPLADLPGELIGRGRTGDAVLSVLEIDRSELGRGEDADDDRTSLVVFLRTPYNDVVLPFAALSVTIERGNRLLAERLEERLDHELGHHYGLEIDPLDSGDRVAVTVETPPQLSRHDGYETAFFAFEEVSATR